MSKNLLKVTAAAVRKGSAESVPKSNGRSRKTSRGMRVQAMFLKTRTDQNKHVASTKQLKKATQWKCGETNHKDVTSHVPKPHLEPLFIHTGMT